MASLFEMINNARALEEKIFENGGELTEELELNTESSNVALIEKIDQIAFVIEQLKIRRQYAVDKMKEWEAIASRSESSIDALTMGLKSFLTFKNQDKFHGFEFTIATQMNPPKVKVVDEAIIPGKYIVTETTTKLDKKAMLNDLKAGNAVPGADIERTDRIVIKPSQRKLTSV